jgi:putative ABC transport system substrate-binding protein
MMRRRDFIKVIAGGATAAGPLAAHAQRAGKPSIIGILATGNPATQGQWFAAFENRLRELGWMEGRTVAIEYRWAEGQVERHAEFAAEFVRLQADVIVTSSVAVLATKQATSIIPIVFAAAVDPVASGMVASLARPGGNVTGLSLQQTDVGPKRLELLREALPSLRGVAILGNVGYSAPLQEIAEVQQAAQMLGLTVVTFGIRRAEDIEPAFDVLKGGGADALYVCGDALVNTYALRINTLALAARLPTMFPNREYVATGGLMSYGANFPSLYRRAAEFVDKILRGSKPSDIPVEQPTKFDLVINLQTAKALRLEVPPTLLARADEVIE